MDPHKRSATIEVMTADETIVGGGRFGTDRDGYAAMLRHARQSPDRVWAIEGCAGIGKHIALRLLAGGEQVLFAATGTTLLDLPGIGPTDAARLLVEAGDITRFPDKAHFASWNGTAPIDASSGDQVRHRLSRAGNRQINRVLHTIARVQLRNPSPGRDYYERKKANGKAPMEAMRCVKRRLSDIVYQQMLNDTVRATTTQSRTGPGGQQGNDSDSSATGSHPNTGSSDKPLPGPAEQQPTTPLPTAS
ncbi:hypothetical protein E0H73_45315 [Kribbella pittospori]|uniref:Transposase IS116/IS110/IS902 C-terminal domain-containing protein n=1 Tax=Kribbella pittospori TaxID=722689 RepID=A0A4R0JJF3_9ACTN|nr:transposase [Kribbella pittospori]TCC44838.1 hypothetical protein E0H73_45315 [Kribbella pittospori]